MFCLFYFANEPVHRVSLEICARSDRADNFFICPVSPGNIDPAENLLLAAANASAQPIENDVVEFEAFCTMHGHNLDT